jgi:predicted nucleic acid-binding protein
VTPVLVDSGFFIALYNQRESAHRRCVEAYASVRGPLITCEACITEALHILDHAAPAVESILTSIEQASLRIPISLGDATQEIRELMRKYRDTPADFADACLIHLADRFDTGDILTLDSDFKHYRWRRNRQFRLLIPLD